MVMKQGIFGVKKVVANMNKAIVLSDEQSQAALIRAAIFIRRDMSKVSPLVPVEHRNLDSSFFIVAPKTTPEKGGSFKGDDSSKLSSGHSSVTSKEKGKVTAFPYPSVGMGFTAYYATYVHEMPATNKFKKAGSGPKFFESAIIRTKEQVKEILKTGLVK